VQARQRDGKRLGRGVGMASRLGRHAGPASVGPFPSQTDQGKQRPVAPQVQMLCTIPQVLKVTLLWPSAAAPGLQDGLGQDPAPTLPVTHTWGRRLLSPCPVCVSRPVPIPGLLAHHPLRPDAAREGDKEAEKTLIAAPGPWPGCSPHTEQVCSWGG
jgi:hypothetical protein